MLTKRIVEVFSPLVDVLLLPLALPSAAVLWLVRRIGMKRMPMCRTMLLHVGLLPVRHHYYEPFTAPSDLMRPLTGIRRLPGINWNVSGQLAFLNELTYADEVRDLLGPGANSSGFRLDNGSFESGDAEYLYQLIRHIKPARVYEVGSGNSTLIARAALRRNLADDSGYACRHLCIEPYEAPWLEQEGIDVIRMRVEEVGNQLFEELEPGDLLFIDSSHVIRPQGDVLTEYLDILPSLRPGVIVHVHDIFSPRDYPPEWLTESLLLWNEQYLLEAFLTSNRDWEVLGALNMLKHEHFTALQKTCPYLTPDREPGSFYMRRLA